MMKQRQRFSTRFSQPNSPGEDWGWQPCAASSVDIREGFRYTALLAKARSSGCFCPWRKTNSLFKKRVSPWSAIRRGGAIPVEAIVGKSYGVRLDVSYFVMSYALK